MKIKTLMAVGCLSLSMLIVTRIVLANGLNPLGQAQANQSFRESQNIYPATAIRSNGPITRHVFLPLVVRSDICVPTGETYATLPPNNPFSGDASTQPDFNLAVRGYQPTSAALSLVDYAGSIDPAAPQLYTLFGDNRTPTFKAAYQVYRWDWTCNCRGGPILKWAVTLLGMATRPGELIHAPVAGYDIGGGYGMMVLYAEQHRLTLQYTRDDGVTTGYTIHLENICVDPNLLALYRTSNANGRSELPVLFPDQPLGRAISSEIDAAVRDGGSFLDPRSRKDWWQGR
ncbi:MAG TPA: hypothetical protein VFK30_06070 [Anaerolineae bacterium]|nr:hypothetical protein [Anaerolineae bacterium]